VRWSEEFDEKGASRDLARELSGAGLPVDMTKVL
jgi:hypothetical protein